MQRNKKPVIKTKPKPVKDNKTKMINDMLEEWKIEMYKENSYLMKIPERAIRNKRQELIKVVG